MTANRKIDLSAHLGSNGKIGINSDEFMFQFNKGEYDSLRFQTGSLKRGAHSKYSPYVFTE